jgi:hypothetical protein
MTNEPNNIPPVIVSTRRHHLNCIDKPIDKEYAQQLWYIVSGACECGGLGNGSWGWTSHPVQNWKKYNEVKEDDYTATYPYVALRMENFEDEEVMSEYIHVSAEWLHNKVIKFVNDKKNPPHLRNHYANLLVNRELPDDHDAVTCDALLQYAFVNDIVFG